MTPPTENPIDPSTPARLRRFAPHLAVAAFAAVALASPGGAVAAVRGLADRFLIHFDWLTLALSGFCLVFCAAAAIGPWGALRLGGAEARPEFSRITWVSMLFAAGMGAGLVFWGAAEPLIFTLSPPPGGAEAGTPAARRDAFALTLFHWTLHPWAIYATAALAVGYAVGAAPGRPASGPAAYAPSAPFHGAPPRLRRLIDWAAIFAVIFGVVASVGQGAMQLGGGLATIAGVGAERPLAVQIGAVVALAGAYLLSAVGGLARGIKPLSQFNMALSGVLLVFVVVAGPTGEAFAALAESGAAYLSGVVRLSTELRPEGAGRQWTRDWTLTYLLWWVAWTPFVGVFIARISHGRTVREFVLGVVLAPSLLTWVWFAAFGGAALDAELARGVDLGVADFSTAPSAAYALLETYVFASAAQAATLLLVAVFIVTSADSGAFVLAMLSSGEARPPVSERVFWGVLIAALTAAAIASGGGQNATRAFAVVGSIPLCALLAAQAGALGRQLVRDAGASAAQRAAHSD